MQRVKLQAFATENIDRLVGWIPTREFLTRWAGLGFQEDGLIREAYRFEGRLEDYHFMRLLEDERKQLRI